MTIWVKVCISWWYAYRLFNMLPYQGKKCYPRLGSIIFIYAIEWPGLEFTIIALMCPSCSKCQGCSQGWAKRAQAPPWIWSGPHQMPKFEVFPLGPGGWSSWNALIQDERPLPLGQSWLCPWMELCCLCHACCYSCDVVCIVWWTSCLLLTVVPWGQAS